MRKSEIRLVKGVGFSKGWAALALKKPPPLVPNCLIASCEATGPRARVCLAALQRGDVVIGREVLDHALRDQHQREDEADGKEQVEDRAVQIDPEIAERVRTRGTAPPGEASGNTERHGDAGGGRGEVVPGQPRHLREVAHRRFAAVRLPVGVRDEAGGRVERQLLRNAGEVLRVERQVTLQAQDRVGHDDAEGAEGQEREAVAFPVLLDLWIDAEELVDEALDPAEEAPERRLAGFENPVHEEPERLRDRHDEAEEDENLHPADESHDRCPFPRLEALGAHERVDEVGGQKDRDECADSVLESHGCPPTGVPSIAHRARRPQRSPR